MAKRGIVDAFVGYDGRANILGKLLTGSQALAWELRSRGSASFGKWRQSLRICVTRPEPGNE